MLQQIPKQCATSHQKKLHKTLRTLTSQKEYGTRPYIVNSEFIITNLSDLFGGRVAL